MFDSSWRIILGPTNGNGSTDFFNGITPVPVTIYDGDIATVPEPGSIVMGSLGVVALGLVALRKRRARRGG